MKRWVGNTGRPRHGRLIVISVLALQLRIRPLACMGRRQRDGGHVEIPPGSRYCPAVVSRDLRLVLFRRNEYFEAPCDWFVGTTNPLQPDLSYAYASYPLIKGIEDEGESQPGPRSLKFARVVQSDGTGDEEYSRQRVRKGDSSLHD